MRFAVAPAKFTHERVFLAALADACQALGHTRTSHESPRWQFLLQWGAEPHLPGTLHCELGWLPRWSYQVSWTGINAEHHEAGRQGKAPHDPDAVRGHLRRVRRGEGAPNKGWGYCDPTVAPSEAFRSPYILAPLQVPADVNMRTLPKHLRTPQGFADAVIEARPLDLPVCFKQHPAYSERERVVDVPKPHKIIPHRQGQIASYLKSAECRMVLVGNSNVLHDALLWSKPVRSFGSGFWGPSTAFTPGADRTLAYLEHVIANQWSIETMTPERVGRLLDDVS